LYLDLFDELKLNKKLVKLAGFEVAAYWAELQSILKQVVKKQTMDEQGFFPLDRNYVERETTLTVSKQLKAEEALIKLGVLLRNPEDPNRIAIAVNGMVAVITDEDTTKLKKTGKTSADEKAAKIAGMKATMKKALVETDYNTRLAYERWIDGMIDAQNCRFTKAVVQLFEKTVTEYTQNRDLRIKIIEIATTNSYKDATWAINKLGGNFKTAGTFIGVPQKQNVGIDPNSIF
jgi:hypothetical protein